MPLRVKDLYQFLEEFAPLNLAEKDDKNGLQIGSFEAEVNGILLGVSPSFSLFQKAIREGFNLIITHHPIFYQSISSLNLDTYPGTLVYLAIKNGLNLLSWHTPLDKIGEGVSEALAKALGWKTEDFALKTGEASGFGKVVNFENYVKLESLAQEIKRKLNTWVMFVGNPEKEIKKLAICGGSGGFLKEHLQKKGIDTLLTSDIKYHQALLAQEESFNYILIDHGKAEFYVLKVLKERIEEFLKGKEEGLKIEIYEEESPYKIV